MNDEWKEEYKKRYVPNCGDDEVCIAFWKDNIDFIDQALVSQKQEILDDVWKLMMDCLPKDAENLSSLTDDQAGRLMRCFLAKNPWN